MTPPSVLPTKEVQTGRLVVLSGQQPSQFKGSRVAFSIGWVVEAAGVEPAPPQNANWLMARDFRRNCLETRCLVVNSLCSGVLPGLVAVGTPVARLPQHRSGRAGLPHPAPTLGDDAETHEQTVRFNSSTTATGSRSRTTSSTPGPASVTSRTEAAITRTSWWETTSTSAPATRRQGRSRTPSRAS